MKSKLAAILLASATLGAGPAIFAPPATAQAQVEVSFEFFRESLSPYGEWIEVGDYGLCWRPTDVSEDWAPYTDGYWSYTDAGWTWVSYEDFGAVAYHYGRWVSVEDEGWCWVPDYEWGPAWVSWRNNDDYIGWAPLPPEADWEPDRGFSVWVDTSYDIGPSYYNFCAVEDFGAPVIREVIIERPRNFIIIGDTFNITNITINRDIGVPFCGGPRFDFIRGRSRRPIPTLKLVRETNITNIENNTYINKTVIRNGGGRRGFRSAVEGNQLIVPAPKVRRFDKAKAVAEVQPKRRVAANRVNRGWKGAKDENQRRELKEKLAKQTEGRRPDNARAKPVEVAELKPVPEKADPNAPSPVAGRNRDREKKQDRKTPEVAGTEKPERPGRADRPDRPGREDRPGNGDRAEKEKRDKANEPAGVAGRGKLKPFNGAGEERKEQPGSAEAPAVPAPSPMVTETPGGEREGKRKQAERGEKDREERQAKAKRASEEAQGQAAENRRQKMQADEAKSQQRQKERSEQAQQEAAAARRQEAAQQELRQQRRQQQMENAENQQRRQQRAPEAQIQERRQERSNQENRQQQMQAQQRQQAARQQQQQAIQQQRQMQMERQIQRQQQRPQAQPRPQVQQQRPQMQQRPQAQPRPQQQQQFRQQSGGGGGGGGRNRNLSPEEAAARGRR